MGVTKLKLVPQLLIAKFNYTGPTGPDQTLSETRGCVPGLAKKSARVRARPVGYGRARVVEFSLYDA